MASLRTERGHLLEGVAGLLKCLDDTRLGFVTLCEQPETEQEPGCEYPRPVQFAASVQAVDPGSQAYEAYFTKHMLFTDLSDLDALNPT